VYLCCRFYKTITKGFGDEGVGDRKGIIDESIPNKELHTIDL